MGFDSLAILGYGCSACHSIYKINGMKWDEAQKEFGCVLEHRHHLKRESTCFLRDELGLLYRHHRVLDARVLASLGMDWDCCIGIILYAMILPSSGTNLDI